MKARARAMHALGNAVAANDERAMKVMLGANFRDFIPQLMRRYVRNLKAWRVSHEVRITGNRAIIFVGDDGWTLPIPLTRTAKAGISTPAQAPNEMRVRRIGQNELSVMEIMLAVWNARVDNSRVFIDTPPAPLQWLRAELTDKRNLGISKSPRQCFITAITLRLLPRQVPLCGAIGRLSHR